MQIFFPTEEEAETRVSVLPETVKKFTEIGIDIKEYQTSFQTLKYLS